MRIPYSVYQTGIPVRFFGKSVIFIKECKIVMKYLLYVEKFSSVIILTYWLSKCDRFFSVYGKSLNLSRFLYKAGTKTKLN